VALPYPTFDFLIVSLFSVPSNSPVGIGCSTRVTYLAVDSDAGGKSRHSSVGPAQRAACAGAGGPTAHRGPAESASFEGGGVAATYVERRSDSCRRRAERAMAQLGARSGISAAAETVPRTVSVPPLRIASPVFLAFSPLLPEREDSSSSSSSIDPIGCVRVRND